MKVSNSEYRIYNSLHDIVNENMLPTDDRVLFSKRELRDTICFLLNYSTTKVVDIKKLLNYDEDDFLFMVYSTLLDRPPEESATSSWDIDNNQSYQAKRNLISVIVSSTEYKQNCAYKKLINKDTLPE